jgi:O-antigen ligase
MFIQIIYIFFGFFLSINQGITLIIGTLSTGSPFGVDVFMPSDFFMFLLLIFQRDNSRRSRYYPLILCSKIAVAVFFALTFHGISPAEEPLRVEFQIVHLSRALLIFYCLASRLHDIRNVRAFVYGLLFGLCFQAFIGFYQWQFGAITIPYLKTGTYMGRVTGTLAVSNAFGVYLISLLPLAIRIFLFTDLKPKILWIVIVCMGVGALFATFTRGAWISFVASMAIFISRDILIRKISMRKKITVMILVIVSGTFIGFKYGSYITGKMEGSEKSLMGGQKQSRLNLAKDALRIINDNKLFGVGLDQYRYYADPEIPGLRIVHNAYLLICAEQGIPSFLLFMIIQSMGFYAGIKLLKSRDNMIFNVAAATLTSFVAISIYHMVAPDYRMIGVLLQHWRISGMLLGLLICNDVYEKKLRGYNVRPPSQRIQKPPSFRHQRFQE